MTKLTDTQAVLLLAAAQRADANLLPSPDTLGAPADRVRKAVASLIKRALAQEVEVVTPEHSWREDGDLRWGAVLTDAGRTAIGVEPEEPAAGTNEAGAHEAATDDAAPAAVAAEPDILAPAILELPHPEQSAEPVPVPAGEGRQTKAALVLELLRRQQGATLAELVEATGWLPHTTRAALTGLRKKGHEVARGKRGDLTCYTIASAA